MSLKIECLGCCWMSRAGVVVWRCNQAQCPFNKFYFKPSIPTVETCFT